MLYSESSKKSGGSGGSNISANSNHLFRRPMGIAVLNISDLLLLGHSHVMGGSLSNAGAGGYSTNTLSANMWNSTSATLGEEREFTIKVCIKVYGCFITK